MSDVLWAAIIGLVAVAILAPLLKWLIWDRVYRLRVDVAIYETKTEPFIEELLNKQAKNFLPSDPATYERLQNNSAYKNYIRLTIQNTSRKKIGGISLLMSDPPWWGWAQVDEGTPIRVTANKIPIGELQPHHKSVVQIWSSNSIGGWKLKKRFRISADEIDRVRMRIPMPEYLKAVYQLRFANMLLYIWIVFMVGATILAIITRKT